MSVTKPASRPSYVADEQDSVFNVMSASLDLNFWFRYSERKPVSGQNIGGYPRNRSVSVYDRKK